MRRLPLALRLVLPVALVLTFALLAATPETDWSDESAGHLDLGIAHAASQRWPEAVEAFQAAVRTAPDGAFEARFDLALALFGARRYEDALEALGEPPPGLAPAVAGRARVLQAKALRSLGRGDEAFESWLAAFRDGQLDTAGLWELMGLARLRGETGTLEAVLDALEAREVERGASSARIPARFAIQVERVDALLRAGRTDDALELARMAREGLATPGDELGGEVDELLAEAEAALAGDGDGDGDRDPGTVAGTALDIAANLLRATAAYTEQATALRGGASGSVGRTLSAEPLRPAFPAEPGPAPGPLAIRAERPAPAGARGLCTGRDGVWVVGDGGARLVGGDRAVEGPATDCLAADLDRDGAEDLVLFGPRGSRVAWGGDGEPAETVVSETPEAAAALLDHDLDGDLDLAHVQTAGTVSLWRNHRDRTGEPVPLPALPDGPGSDGHDGAPRGLLATDLHADGVGDLLIWTGRETFVLSGLSGVEGHATIATRADGEPGEAGGPLTVADWDGDGRIEPLPAGLARDPSPVRALGAADLDRDGLPDLLALTREDGLEVHRNLGPAPVSGPGGARFEPWPLDAPLGAPVRDAAFLDLDGDGEAGVVVLLPDRLLELGPTPSAAGPPPAISLSLAASKDNPDAVGSRIELLAGRLRTVREVRLGSSEIGDQGPRQVLGLGGRPAGHWLKVTWPNETWSDALEPPAGPIALEQPEGLVGSCPFLYLWDGERFRFETDLLGGAPLGLPVGGGAHMPTDPTETVLIRGDRLAAVDGEYRLRITEELREILYLDRVELLAVDRPEGVELATPDGLTRPPFPGERLYAADDARPPLSARDHRGRDVTDRLAAIDGRYPDGFASLAFQGYAEEHSVTLRFPAPASPQRAVLIVHGGFYWPEADGVAFAQSRRFAPRPPRLEARVRSPEGGDGWRTVLPSMPFPGGRPKTVAVDLAGRLPAEALRPDGTVELRISSNFRVYWDRLLLGSDGVDRMGEERAIRLRPLAARAELRHRGYSVALPGDGRVPRPYDYHRTVPGRPFPAFEGLYTRFGDVSGLLAEADGALVVLHHGEEVALAFPAPPPPPPGFRRDFLLRLVGWDKDGDPKIAGGRRVAPLPFVGMERYPYRPPERYPWTAESARADRETRTRWIPGASSW